MSRILTKDEIEALPDGAPITVTWSGGNGPHHYRVIRNTDGTVCAATDWEYERGIADQVGKSLTGPASFVGIQSFHTRVISETT